MKILVTGGLGFIGSKLVEILSLNNSITILDNKDTYGLLSKEEENTLYKQRTKNWIHKNTQIVDGDILDQNACLKVFEYKPDIVIHLAAYPRAAIVDDNPILGVPKLISGTTNILYNCGLFNVKKMIYTSSSMVYGNFTDGIKEDANTKPTNIYGEAKLTGERLTKLFAKKNNMSYIIIRPSAVYGLNDLPDRVVPKFFKKAINNETITLHNGNNKADFTFRDDAVDGIIKATFSDIKNESFNLTAGQAFSLKTLSEKVKDITGSKSKVEDIGSHNLYPTRGTLDISKAKNMLNYHPKINFESGLKLYYESIQNTI
jgi:UDP-glucuronate 4-epimerase